MDAHVDLPRASQLPVRPQFHPRGIFGFLPLPPAGPCLRASEREAPHLSILSLSHSFLVKNEADAYPLAGDNVRINDKICKARSAAFGRGKKKKSAVDVLFSLNPDFCVSFLSSPSEKLF